MPLRFLGTPWNPGADCEFPDDEDWCGISRHVGIRRMACGPLARPRGCNPRRADLVPRWRGNRDAQPMVPALQRRRHACHAIHPW